MADSTIDTTTTTAASPLPAACPTLAAARLLRRRIATQVPRHPTQTGCTVEIDPPEHVCLRRPVGESLFYAPQPDHEIAPKPLSASSRLAS